MRVSLALTFVCALPLLAQVPETYKARLSAVPVEAKTRPDIAGLGSATATLTGTRLSITGSFDGLRSPALAAKLHQGPATGVRGPAILDLTLADAKSGATSGAIGGAISGAISASLDLTPQQIESLKKGRLYIQIDSEKAPDGNLWGWLLR